MVLGIPDVWIWSVFLLCILSTALCVIYGLLNWKRGMDDEDEQIKEEVKWEKKDSKLNERL